MASVSVLGFVVTVFVLAGLGVHVLYVFHVSNASLVGEEVVVNSWWLLRALELIIGVVFISVLIRLDRLKEVIYAKNSSLTIFHLSIRRSE